MAVLSHTGSRFSTSSSRSQRLCCYFLAVELIVTGSCGISDSGHSLPLASSMMGLRQALMSQYCGFLTFQTRKQRDLFRTEGQAHSLWGRL